MPVSGSPSSERRAGDGNAPVSGPPLRLTGGWVTLAGRIVLRDVDFELREQECVALLGANGSGKTTLVRSLLGLVPLQRGELTVFGQPLKAFRQWHRLGYVPQRLTAVSGVPATVMEVVLSGLSARSSRFRSWSKDEVEAARRALHAVDLVDLRQRSCAQLSGGQQQRVLIARALVADPEVLVLDEPLAGVDVEHQEAFADTLAGLRARGRSILLVAHDLGTFGELVSRAVVLEAGRVSYDGEALPEHLEAQHLHPHAPVPPHRPRGLGVGRP